ncbi:MAG: hypothetical protein AAFR00_10330 [Pseudomonadota bacterium]
MGYYNQPNLGGGKHKSTKTPGRLHDDRRWQSMMWGFLGLILGLLFGVIGAGMAGGGAARPALSGLSTASEASAGAEACSLTAGGAIDETPCTLSAATLSAFMDVAGPMDLLGAAGPPVETLPDCRRSDDGAITGAPCRFGANLPAILRANGVGTASAPPTPEMPGPCFVTNDGGVTGAPCLLQTAVSAPPPLPRCTISMVDGTVTGAPCRLAANFRALNNSRTLDAEMVPRERPAPAASTLADCRINRADQSITNAPCRLDQSFRPVLDASFGPVPKLALKVCPTRGFSTPEDLGCGLRVRDSGHVALSKIAEAYYGDTDAACMIYDRNRDVFGTRTSPVRRNDPHCILPEDILFLPATAPDEDFGRCVTPPRQANVCEAS